MQHPLGYSLIEEFNNNKNRNKKNQKEGMSSIEKKKTRKNRSALNTKVEKFLQSIEKTDDDENEAFSDFNANQESHNQSLTNNAYARPTSVYSNQLNQNSVMPTEEHQQSTDDDDELVQREEFNTIQQQPYQNYYNTYVPYSTNVANNQSLSGEKDMLIEKLNYMIHLLEEQQEEKTGHVTEELILYTFLGVFVIFVIDSFARAGKYVR